MRYSSSVRREAIHLQGITPRCHGSDNEEKVDRASQAKAAAGTSADIPMPGPQGTSGDRNVAGDGGCKKFVGTNFFRRGGGVVWRRKR
jgi:hypothetical protein